MSDFESTFRFKPMMGTDEATVDNKGRIVIGRKKRDALGEEFVVYIGDLGCLVLVPMYRWQEILSYINDKAPWGTGRQTYARMVIGTAEMVTFDSVGRFVIPKQLRDKTIQSDLVLVIGCGDHLEIWEREEYERYRYNPGDYHCDRRIALERAYEQMKSDL